MRFSTHTFVIGDLEDILDAAENALAAELPGAALTRGSDENGNPTVEAKSIQRGIRANAIIVAIPVPSGTRVEYTIDVQGVTLFRKAMLLASRTMPESLEEAEAGVLDRLVEYVPPPGIDR